MPLYRWHLSLRIARRIKGLSPSKAPLTLSAGFLHSHFLLFDLIVPCLHASKGYPQSSGKGTFATSSCGSAVKLPRCTALVASHYNLFFRSLRAPSVRISLLSPSYRTVGYSGTTALLLDGAPRNTGLKTRRSQLHQARWHNPSFFKLLISPFPCSFVSSFLRRSARGTQLRQYLRAPSLSRCHTNRQEKCCLSEDKLAQTW